MNRKFWKDLADNKKEELAGILWFVITVFIVISLFPHPSRKNYLGILGLYFEKFIIHLTGCASTFIPLVTGFFGWLKLTHRKIKNPYSKLAGSFLVSLSVLILFDLLSRYAFFGGIIGATFSKALQRVIGRAGTYILVLAGIILSLYLLEIEYVLIKAWKGLNNLSSRVFQRIKLKFGEVKPAMDEIAETQSQKAIIPEKREKKKQKKEEIIRKDDTRESEIKTQDIYNKEYKLPSISLFSDSNQEGARIKDDTREVARILEEALGNFGIEVKVTGVSPGPVITRYELEPAPGTKINRIVSLSDDIALSLKATHIRVVAPIPGKGAVGVEVPNRQWEMVPLSDLIDSDSWRKSNKLLTVALGKSIDGIPIVEDLTSMPHILIAGATGSGKSVCINSIIVSLLYKANPSELKLFLIDPKRIELSIMSGLPHLYAPIISDAKIASEALKRIIAEMESRYKKLASLGYRDIMTFNSRIKSNEERIPYIVIIIDELADLMLVAARDVEESITRLAQLARGVGIHLVLATQRPSVDVITGVIKANLPARIAFQVSSKVDSRTILDMNGAEELIGRGDMLFFPSNVSKPIRAQGSFVSTDEIERIVEFWKNQGIPQYEENILAKMSKQSEEIIEDETDTEVFKNALLLIKDRKKASIQLLQGALHISGGRASNLISLMETKGLIGPGQGSKPREIYLDRIESLINTLN